MNTITAEQFKEGMKLLTGAVTIVATSGKYGKGGLTATAICSVSDAPPTLLVCINKSNEIIDIINNNKSFSVNILSYKHKNLANRFAGFIKGVSLEERFDEGNWSIQNNSSPILQDALVSFDCNWKTSIQEGSHYIILGEIKKVHMGTEGNPLLYFNRNYSEIK